MDTRFRATASRARRTWRAPGKFRGHGEIAGLKEGQAEMRDDIVNGSFGVKFAPARNTIIVLNVLFPLNRGGLRPNLAYTVGLERTF